MHADYPVDAAAILLCELDGTHEEVSEGIARVRELLLKQGATEVRTARDEAERLRMWAGRKAAFPAVGRLAPDYYCMDGTVPRRHIATVLKRIGELSKEYGLPVANVLHAGDGNLHPLILYDANKPGDLERTETLGGKILELCVEVGGTITGEHGVGVEKINQMCAIHAAGTGAVSCPQTRLRSGWHSQSRQGGTDAGALRQFGRMHVHAGQLPFPRSGKNFDMNLCRKDAENAEKT